MVSNYVLVEPGVGPAFAPRPYGLASVATVVDDGSTRWKNGQLWLPEGCGDADGLVNVCVTGGPTLTIDDDDGDPGRSADAFTVWAGVTCSPVGFGNDLADLKRAAETNLTRGEARAAEHVVWTGEASNGTVYPHLADDAALAGDPQGGQLFTRQTAATTVTSAAVRPARAVSLLEGALGECYGGVGVIHVPLEALALLDEAQVVRRDGQVLRTLLGTAVAGYGSNDRHGPTGVEPAAGEGWFYATGAVMMRRSPVFDRAPTAAEAMDRLQNDAKFYVGRHYLVDWECCHLAAQVDLAGA